jgi:hypothetical protein
MDLREIGWWGVECIQLAQYRDRWWAVVKNEFLRASIFSKWGFLFQFMVICYIEKIVTFETLTIFTEPIFL